MKRRLRLIVFFIAVFVGVAYIAGAIMARGAIAFFSPDSLECRSQSEVLLPFTRFTLYRSGYSYHKYDLVSFLEKEGYWAPSESSEPCWIQTYRWNQQWRDGQSSLHRELGWNGKEWIEWTRANPDLARLLWADVIALLRGSAIDKDHAALRLMTVRMLSSMSVDEYRERFDDATPR